MCHTRSIIPILISLRTKKRQRLSIERHPVYVNRVFFFNRKKSQKRCIERYTLNHARVVFVSSVLL